MTRAASPWSVDLRLPGSAAGSPWIWSQLTLAHDSLVGLSDALYLILKLAGAHRQSFDDDICAVRHVQATRFRKKQTLTNLEVVFGHLRATAAQENQAVESVTFRLGLCAVCSGLTDCKFQCVAPRQRSRDFTRR